MGKQLDGVRPASESSIEIDFYYRGTRCRERLRLKPSPSNLKRASNHRAAILDAIEKGEFDYAVTFPKSKNVAKFADKTPSGTLAEFLEPWIESKAPTIKASTALDYRKIIKGHLIPALGAIPLVRLRRSDVKAMCEGIQATNKRLANILSVLRSALTDAVTDEMIDVNPISGWAYKRNEPPSEEDHVDPFTADEQEIILKTLSGQGRNLIQFALWTGLRTSELVGLRWNDIDFIRGEVRIRRAETQAAAEAETPKTRSGNRTVKLLSPARQALESQKAFTFLANERVFHNPRTNEPWTGDQPIRKTLWQPALKKAGVRYRIPYQTRHTYASMMLSAGEHPMWVAQQMGHADWGMIRRIYGRWMPEAAPDAGRAAEAMFSNVRGQHLVSIEKAS
ncbi:tyrosine-type recombinase/integrase [Parapusillimonas sp. JC17]|uniref:tyrosine-type recombinase/integrase n=1 Tax=Parapusillimonas sp. JC17 TaxID=3445768 RepID=UPI003F9F6E0C